MEEKQITQLSWYYTAGNHILTAKYPDGIGQDFNLAKLVNGMTSSQELIFQYGFKQWIASAFSKLYKNEKQHGTKYIPTDEEKRELAKEMLKDTETYGIFLHENGTQIKIATPENLEGNKTGGTKSLLTKANNMIELMKKRMNGQEMTNDENNWLDEMLATYK